MTTGCWPWPTKFSERKVERLERGGAWVRCRFEALRKGDIFCLFDVDDEAVLIGTYMAETDVREGGLRCTMVKPTQEKS